MRIDGKWSLGKDRVLRPVFLARLQAHDGSWPEFPFLADSGADRTVLSANVFQALNLPVEKEDALSGLGGIADSALIATTIQFVKEDGGHIQITGEVAAVTDPAALDMSLLGRDITNLFTLIVDRKQEVVCLIGQRHRYQIIQD